MAKTTSNVLFDGGVGMVVGLGLAWALTCRHGC
jgi:hypothetical protein